MAVSTAPAVKAQLKARLDASPDLAAVQVNWAAPSAQQEREAFYLGRVTATEGWATNRSRDEEYILEVVISVVRAFEDDAQETAERAFELFGVLREILEEDPTLDCTVSENVVVDGWTLEEPANAPEAWREAAITARLKCRNRLTP